MQEQMQNRLPVQISSENLNTRLQPPGHKCVPREPSHAKALWQVPKAIRGDWPMKAQLPIQALVEHYAGLGRPDEVERCVLRMDIASLDFNQIVKLCRQHHLLSALAYILNRGLNDFVTPAAELLLAMLSAPELSETATAVVSGGTEVSGLATAGAANPRESAACKLLAYLRCCFRGEAFPPGPPPSPPPPN